MTIKEWESMNYERKIAYISTLGFKTIKEFEVLLYEN